MNDGRKKEYERMPCNNSKDQKGNGIEPKANKNRKRDLER
jgi:hypothetical protein